MRNVRIAIDSRQRGRASSLLSCIVIAFALATPLHAQTCSGGVDGGMDATGSACNSPIAAVPSDSTVATAKVGQRREGAAGETSDPRLGAGSAATRPVLTNAAIPKRIAPLIHARGEASSAHGAQELLR